jgi:hypothetical protein
LNNQREKRALITEMWVEMIRGVLRCFYLLWVQPEELVESKVKYTRKKYSSIGPFILSLKNTKRSQIKNFLPLGFDSNFKHNSMPLVIQILLNK